MKGKIIRGVGGFYYVHAQDGNIYECRAKGIFRKEKQKPLVGDDVEMSIVPDNEKLAGNVEALLPRRNALIRPAAANVDQALVVFAAAAPAPNLNLLDRFLISMEQQQIPVIICFNKTDLVDDAGLERLADAYAGSGYRVCMTCVARGEGIDEIQELLEGRTTVVAGPSGGGKSSLTNQLQSDVQMEVGSISEKIDRGKHTTRHTELIVLRKDTYFLDTPGFSSLTVQNIESGHLRDYFHEFDRYEPECRFQGCVHIHEPDCAVKAALEEGAISRERYDNYVLIYEELKNRRKY
jgi:ribosome biogenesis GTPase